MANKNIDKLVVSSHFKGKNLAFLDAEYLCGRIKSGSVEDVISIGIVITDPEFNELDRYYSTVKLMRGHKLTPVIIKLTGLTNEMLKKAPDYETVFTELVKLVKKHHVGKICVWGGDKTSFVRDFNRRHIENPLSRDIQRFINTFENIQKDVSLEITGQLDSGLSLADMKTICGLDGAVEHNALSDAVDLLDCIRIITHGQIKRDGVKAAEYKHFRANYVKNRSFSLEEDMDVIFSSEIGEKFLKELEEKKFSEQPKTKAFMDDLKFILGHGDTIMGTYAEMMSEDTNE